MLAFDVPAALAAANEFAATHPNIALVSFALNLLAGVTLLVRKVCALDLMLIDHVGKRRTAIAKLPPKPKRKPQRKLRLVDGSKPKVGQAADRGDPDQPAA